ncbi:MAG: LytR/AlgR family response regulator transcription factor [Cyclobacteriaceae bacterium]
MAEQVKILIVEDELLTATDIKEKLESYEYKVTGIAQTAGEAYLLAKNTDPDIIMLEITLAGQKDGIEAAEMIRDIWQGPIIFLSANSDKQLLKKAIKTNPAAYLLKPFNLNEFAMNIEIAINNFMMQQAHLPNYALGFNPDFLFVPVDYTHQKIKKSSILYLEASGSYVKIKTFQEQIIISTNLGNFEKQLKDPCFFRISRRHLVNMNHIDKIEGNQLIINGQKLLIGESFKAKLFGNFQFIKTK